MKEKKEKLVKFFKRHATDQTLTHSVLLFLMIEVFLVVTVKPQGNFATILLVVATSIVAIPGSFLLLVGLKKLIDQIEKMGK